MFCFRTVTTPNNFLPLDQTLYFTGKSSASYGAYIVVETVIRCVAVPRPIPSLSRSSDSAELKSV